MLSKSLGKSLRRGRRVFRVSVSFIRGVCCRVCFIGCSSVIVAGGSGIPINLVQCQCVYERGSVHGGRCKNARFALSSYELEVVAAIFECPL